MMLANLHSPALTTILDMRPIGDHRPQVMSLNKGQQANTQMRHYPSCRDMVTCRPLATRLLPVHRTGRRNAIRNGRER